MSFTHFLGVFHLSIAFLVFYLLKVGQSSVEVARPRGVSISRIGLYDPEHDFTCFDGSRKIPFNQVNDDYCDCIDGSDEPGTSACPNGSFYCSNAGHKPQILSSDRVNDGICDCCDGHDEYSGKTTCTNTCLEVGKAAREEAARLAELHKAGRQLRTDLIQEGQKLKGEKQQKLTELQKNKEEAEKVKSEREAIKNQAEEAESKALEYYKQLEEQYKKKKAELEAEKEREEAIENFKKLDSNQDGVVDIAEIQSRETFDRDRNGEVSEEEAKLFLGNVNDNSVDQETFIDKTWKLMKPFVARESGLYKPPASESATETEEGQQEDQEHAEDEHDEEEDDEDADDKEPEEEPQDDGHVPYDEETQKLVDAATEARNQYSESEKDVRDISNQIRQIEDSLKKDFGTEEEFATLEGQCFELRDHEYIYKLCPFDRTVQIPLSSSMETNLGKWSRWDGPSGSQYSLMLYDHGQNCWNGPNRSTKVKVSCGTENKVTSVSEPNRCEYAFDFQTPAACRDQNDQGETDVHDEL